MNWEIRCLAVDPFAGDFEGAGSSDRVLSDKMVTARKATPCHTCAEPIALGTRARRRTEVFDGEFMSFGWCEPCCRLMGSDEDDAMDRLEARFASGQAIRDATRTTEADT